MKRKQQQRPMHDSTFSLIHQITETLFTHKSVEHQISAALFAQRQHKFRLRFVVQISISKHTPNSFSLCSAPQLQLLALQMSFFLPSTLSQHDNERKSFLRKFSLTHIESFSIHKLKMISQIISNNKRLSDHDREGMRRSTPITPSLSSRSLDFPPSSSCRHVMK